MYRYCVDNAVTYTSEDFVLYRESAFACWMERLTLENPDHGIPPDLDSTPPGNTMERQDDLGDTLRTEGKNVCIIDWDAEEPVKRSSTLEAMRQGVDFIVNGQLALGPLSGSANLLMRTSGYSELGNYLYIPCDTQAKTTMNSAFRLCFLADLLHSLQGQLPPQMLIIRGGSDLLPLQTEDHIYHYRAVKQRFMETMRDFRKHRMPDPVESSHFGRWSDCANEVLKQRVLRADEQEQGQDQDHEQEQEQDQGQEQEQEQYAPTPEFDSPLPQAASAAAAPLPMMEQPVVQPQIGQQQGAQPQGRIAGSKGLAVSGTLADQAKMLLGDSVPITTEPQRRFPDEALQNLEFIGSSLRSPRIGERGTQAEPTAATSPELREPEARETGPQEVEPPETESASEQAAPHPLDSSGFSVASGIDRDEIEPLETPQSGLDTDTQEFEVDCIDDSDYVLPQEPEHQPFVGEWEAEAVDRVAEDIVAVAPTRPFSSCLNTSGADQD